MKTNKQRIQRITGIGLFSAAVIVLQFVSMSVRFTTFSITLTLIPIVVGAAIYGIGAGAWLGLVFGLAVLLTGDAASAPTARVRSSASSYAKPPPVPPRVNAGRSTTG